MERIARMIYFVMEYHEDCWVKGKTSSALIREGIDACKDATQSERELVYILLTVAWNDAHIWAKSVIEINIQAAQAAGLLV